MTPVMNFPSGRQTFNFDCGPKALQLVLAYYGVDVREDELLAKLRADDLGTQPEDMNRVAESYGFIAATFTNCTLNSIKAYVDDNTPVIVLVQAWADRYMSLSDWRQTNEFGHYVIVIGYSNRAILFEDPATTGRSWLTCREFLARWHDTDPNTGELLNHFVLVLRGQKPVIRVPEHMA